MLRCQSKMRLNNAEDCEPNSIRGGLNKHIAVALAVARENNGSQLTITSILLMSFNFPGRSACRTIYLRNVVFLVVSRYVNAKLDRKVFLPFDSILWATSPPRFIMHHGGQSKQSCRIQSIWFLFIHFEKLFFRWTSITIVHLLFLSRALLMHAFCICSFACTRNTVWVFFFFCFFFGSASFENKVGQSEPLFESLKKWLLRGFAPNKRKRFSLRRAKW